MKNKKPLMGWNSWNAFHTDISEDKLKDQIDKLIELGLADLGYIYLNIDDGYFGGRDEEGNLQSREDRFPNGIKAIADYAHEKGIKAGIYSDAGDSTCASYYDGEGKNGKGVGLYQHEEEDLNLFFDDLDFDFIKVDWCGGLRLGLDEKEQYSKISSIIKEIENRTGKDIVFNICRWQFPGDWVPEVAESWRIGGDIFPEYSSVLYEIDSAKPFAQYSGPGHNNDLDMLEIGNGMSEDEELSHFAMWCLMSSPLVIGTDLTKIPESSLEILKNKELIDINQDSAGLQAFVIKRIQDDQGRLLGEIFIKDLGKANSNTKAIGFLNRNNKELTFNLNLKEAGLLGDIQSVRDVIRHEDKEITGTIDINVKPHGIEVFKITSEESKLVKNLDEQYSEEPLELNSVTIDEINDLIDNGALLIDVRTEQEFEDGHLNQAINIPYIATDHISLEYPEDLEQPIILYCRTGKRASQVYHKLYHLGYKNLYYLGGIEF